MSRIIIGESEHPFCDVSERWIHHHVNERQHDGRPVSARAVLKNHSVDMVLSTPNCPHGHGGGGRPPNEKEAEIFRIWAEEHLNQAHWKAENLHAFVRRARHLVCN